VALIIGRVPPSPEGPVLRGAAAAELRAASWTLGAACLAKVCDLVESAPRLAILALGLALVALDHAWLPKPREARLHDSLNHKPL